jgi:hypothetical protein
MLKINKNRTETIITYIDYIHVHIVQTELSNTLWDEKSVNLIFSLKTTMSDCTNSHGKILPGNSSLATITTYTAQ